ncbi:testis-specific serine/threonine-protein kinase 3-like isoform X2 [Ischnura elegans]|uniref:testis-specific serine/threonine-protein kinase 3-like isoform X2 n=1 Tax=Ischnura elegans TaxID=197161 RepID=UPI001ED8A0C5|nr:testis-specific serine/threonine-protein kinase 3-like isoform X2 [Ischnura elegans]
MRDRLSSPDVTDTRDRQDSLQPGIRNCSVNSSNESSKDPACRTSSISRRSVLESRGYSVGRTIGNGSYATVKLAFSEKHGCDVAVKIVAKYNAPSDYLSKFLPREVNVVKGLSHPNIIHFFEAIETTHRVYIVMEYASNGSLLDVIRNDGHIDESRAKKWFRQLASAIAYCHGLGVVHRDIKCENLLMDHSYNIKLSDFGFARFEPEPLGTGLCETFCGSFAYAPPEILRGIPYQPKQSDVWSMGVVLFAMMYGQLPFDDANYSTLLKQVQKKVAFPPEPEVPEPCKELISRMLSPLRTRPQLPTILCDPWLVDESRTSSTQSGIIGNGAISWKIDELRPGGYANHKRGSRWKK